MSIDRIGKGPRLPPTTTPAAGSAGPTARPFSVGGTGVASATSTTGLSPAEQVRRGDLSLDQYLDLRAQEATRHLEGRLGAADLQRIQQTLRDQLRTDPALQELVRAATGQRLPEDEG